MIAQQRRVPRSAVSRGRTGVGLSVLACAAVALTLIGSPFASAQSPTPTAKFGSVYPGYAAPSGVNGLVVQGVGSGIGSGSCAESESAIESTAVYYIDAKVDTWIELSPQQACASLSTYETEISQIEAYVEGHAASPGTYWLGFMLDEESGSQYEPGSAGYSMLTALNSYVLTSWSTRQVFRGTRPRTSLMDGA